MQKKSPTLYQLNFALASDFYQCFLGKSTTNEKNSKINLNNSNNNSKICDMLNKVKNSLLNENSSKFRSFTLKYINNMMQIFSNEKIFPNLSWIYGFSKL